MKVGTRAEPMPVHRYANVADLGPGAGVLTAADRHGRLVLLAVFVALLGGRFTLDRLGEQLSSLDLRWHALLAVLTMSFLWFAAISYRGDQRQLRPGAGIFFFVAWAGWMACSAVWAQPGARVESYVTDLILLIMFILLASSIMGRLSRQVLRSVWWWLVISGMVYFVAAIYVGPGLQGRFSAFGGGPNVFVRVMVLACFGAFFLAARNSRIVLLTVPVFLTGAVLSGSRGGLVAFLIVMVLGSIPLWRRMPSRPRRSVATIVLGIAVAVPVLIGLPFADELRRRLLVQTLEQQYDSDRGQIAATAIRLFESHPIVGTGLDGYFASTRGAFSYPHNLALATAAEGGIVGAVLLVVALGLFLRTIFASWPLALETLYALLGAIYILVASMFSGDYYDSRFLWFFLVLAAVESRRARPLPLPHSDRPDWAPISGEPAGISGPGSTSASSGLRPRLRN